MMLAPITYLLYAVTNNATTKKKDNRQYTWGVSQRNSVLRKNGVDLLLSAV